MVAMMSVLSHPYAQQASPTSLPDTEKSSRIGGALRIGISQRHRFAQATSFDHDALDSAWADWLQLHWPGSCFVPIPNFREIAQLVSYVQAWQLNVFILSGGDDAHVGTRRAAIETGILDYAEAHGLPVLGVCRGMQVLQLRHGGTLVKVDHHVRVNHTVEMSEGVDEVNSWHQDGVRIAAPGWRVLATAPDGTIEAMRHVQLPWLGLMWHPERAGGDIPAMWPWFEQVFGPSAHHHNHLKGFF